jgi:hypothetical protein
MADLLWYEPGPAAKLNFVSLLARFSFFEEIVVC